MSIPRCLIRSAILLLAFGCVVPAAHAQKQKVIVDQDARGPLTTDINAILMFAQSPDVDVLGVTIVSGDQWVKEETLHTLRALEIAGRPDIPVVPGALYPLL
ncbi:MAG: nucleoside hydrolase, partial [Candidatus Acidiferrales bacterium]